MSHPWTGLTWIQLGLWIQYYRLEPFGEERSDYRVGTLTALTANINRDPKQHAQPFTPYDFMPYLRRPSEDANGNTEEELARQQFNEWEVFLMESKASALAKARASKPV